MTELSELPLYPLVRTDFTELDGSKKKTKKKDKAILCLPPQGTDGRS